MDPQATPLQNEGAERPDVEPSTTVALRRSGARTPRERIAEATRRSRALDRGR